MTQFKIGTCDYPYDRGRYQSTFPVVELRQAGLFAPPKYKTLKRWTEGQAEGFEHVWVAWQSFSHDARSIRSGRQMPLLEGERAAARGLFQNTPENHRVWREVLNCAASIGARKVLVETPTSFAPSPENKARLRAFIQDWGGLEEAGLEIIWDPSGFWQREETIELALELGVILAVDPFVDFDEPLPPGPRGYLRLAGARGLGRDHSSDDLELLADFAACYEEAYVIFRTENALRSARRFRSLVGEGLPDDDDDEDEEDDD